ncbi:MAG: enoyl-CoA hydratase/isomerase family protein [Candidatus Neomarinimicrobiota bacterium]
MVIKKIVKDKIALLTINREKALNAMNPKILKDLKDIFKNCIEDEDINVIILTGSGKKAFIAGADIKIMEKLDSKSAYDFGLLGQELTYIIENSTKPIIALVNGFALGGGCEISLACHIRLASDNAMFGQPEVKLGLIPGWGGTQRLPRIVGKGLATELIITGKIIDSNEAYRIGLVNKILKKNNLIEESFEFAKLILQNGPKAISKSLSCINNSSNSSLNDGLENELETFSKLFGSKETNEGLKAFVEKRLPKF